MQQDEYVFADDDPELVPDSCADDVENVVFDEEGTLPVGVAPPVGVDPNLRPRPCSLAVLDGSWNLSFRPKQSFLFGALRGPMRLEARREVLRASGDIYFKSFVFWRSLRAAANALIDPDELESAAGVSRPGFLFRRNWYPQYPFDEYRWYFRSTGCSYIDGTLQVNFRRHVWDEREGEFAGTDGGWMRFTCESRVHRSFELPRPTVQMTGDAMIGGVPYSVTATKTSPFYRGCVVEVDVMEGRSFPHVAAGQSFAHVYRTAGIDLAVRMSDVDVPEDADLTTAELHALLSTWRDVPGIGRTWRAWLLVGSRRAGSNTFGVMFDQTAPHREGAVGFYDARMSGGSRIAPEARGEDLGDVPAAFLRTLVHEIGHVFNLYHPKHDVHRPPIGTTTMNQTGDVIGFATPGDQYPGNISWTFNGHNRMSLVHSPDPQVAPGWKEFGWGHGSRFGGVPIPFDAVGLDVPAAAPDLTLRLDLPGEAVAGEFLMARISVTNDGETPAEVHRNLNLAEGHVELEVTNPTGRRHGGPRRRLRLRRPRHDRARTGTDRLPGGPGLLHQSWARLRHAGYVRGASAHVRLRRRRRGDRQRVVDPDDRGAVRRRRAPARRAVVGPGRRAQHGARRLRPGRRVGRQARAAGDGGRRDRGRRLAGARERLRPAAPRPAYRRARTLQEDSQGRRGDGEGTGCGTNRAGARARPCRDARRGGGGRDPRLGRPRRCRSGRTRLGAHHEAPPAGDVVEVGDWAVRVVCRVDGPVSAGGRAVLRVTSINDGPEAVEWPVRLHPAEATVSFLVDGVRHRGAQQVDSTVETTVLEPAMAVSTGVLLPVGAVDPLPGGAVEIRVAVQPPGAVDEVISDPVVVEVGDGTGDRGIGRSLDDLDAAARSVRAGEPPGGADLAAMLSELGSHDRAWVATALLPPAPWPDDVLLEAARGLVEQGADDADLDRAVLDGVPHEADATGTDGTSR